MKSTDVQHIGAPAAATSAVLADPRFYLGRESAETITAIELVDHVADGDTAELRIRFGFTGDLNAAARAILDPDKLTWVQVSRHDLATGRVTFEILPDNYADRLRCRGRYAVDSDGEDTSLRTVATELHVKAPLVGGQVEHVIMNGFRSELESQAKAIPDYIP